MLEKHATVYAIVVDQASPWKCKW